MPARRRRLQRRARPRGAGAALAKPESSEASEALARRPQLRAALDEAGQAKCPVVVAKLDRLSRDVAFISSLCPSGCRFWWRNSEPMAKVAGRSNKRGVSLTPDTRFIDDMGLDSLAVMELVTDLEDGFDVNLPLNLLPDIHTIGDLAAGVEKLRGDRDA